MQHKSYEIEVTADLYFNMESSPQEDGGGNFIGPLGPYIFTYPWWGLAKWRGRTRFSLPVDWGFPPQLSRNLLIPLTPGKAPPPPPLVNSPQQIFILPTKGSSHYNFTNNFPVVKFQY